MSRENKEEGTPNNGRRRRTKKRNKRVLPKTGPERQVASVFETLRNPKTAGRATTSVLINTSLIVARVPRHAGDVAGCVAGGVAGGVVGLPFGKPLKGAKIGGKVGSTLGGFAGVVAASPLGLPLELGAPVAGAAASQAVRELNNTRRKLENVKRTLKGERSVGEIFPARTRR